MGRIDAAAKPEMVIASSSSGIPSSQFIHLCKKNPKRMLIGHPFNPPHLIPLVEVVPNPDTDEDSISKAMQFYRSLDKQPIQIHQEAPGFPANRLQVAVAMEADSLVQRGVVSAHDLDVAMTTGLGIRWRSQVHS
jgi:3-hydroxyacyl-CoA dehydrogenase